MCKDFLSMKLIAETTKESWYIWLYKKCKAWHHNNKAYIKVE